MRRLLFAALLLVIGPRVAEPGLMLIDPYPWSAPLEDVRLKPR